MNAPILVTGAEGQVGRALVALGAADGVVGLGRAGLDITNAVAIADVMAHHRPRLVINAAAYTAVDAAEDDEARAYAVNAAGAEALARAAFQAGAGFIHLSTDYVFSGEGARPYLEDDPTGPINTYGRTKLAGELAVLAAHEGACVVRTSGVYAPMGHNFVRTMVGLASTRDRVRVVADQHTTLTHAEDLATALLALAAQGLGRNGLRMLHLTGQGTATWFAFAEAIFARVAATDTKVAVLEPTRARDWPARARRPAYSVLDCGLASANYGCNLPVWQDGLRRCLDQILDSQKPNRG